MAELSGERWQFDSDGEEEDLLQSASKVTFKGFLSMLMHSVDGDNPSTVVPLAHGDPSRFPSFRPPQAAVDAVVSAVRSANYNSYSFPSGHSSARRGVAEYLNPGVPHELSGEDVYLTMGCVQAIEVMIRSVASRPNANILLPRPGFPHYDSVAACYGLEVRHFSLLPERGWEVDLDGVQALSDHNTVAVVVINPGNPTGSVYTRSHLEKIAQTARKLGIVVIADEVYERISFGENPFVAMGVFGSIAPVVTLGSISKRWCVPGWRMGWIVTNDPNHILKNSKLMKKIIACLSMSSTPATIIQGALPEILEKTKDDHFSKVVNLLRETADMCYNKIQEIACLTCPNKPQGSMFVMARLNVSLLDDIIGNDVEFCLNLAKEESVIVLPGTAVGMPDWLRITFAVEPSLLEDGLARIKAFCQRHSINY